MGRQYDRIREARRMDRRHAEDPAAEPLRRGRRCYALAGHREGRMELAVDGIASVLMLGGAFWAVMFLLPKARREQDTFAIVCSLLVALLGLFGWLFIGVGVLSR